jgi:hypothetical protein
MWTVCVESFFFSRGSSILLLPPLVFRDQFFSQSPVVYIDRARWQSADQVTESIYVAPCGMQDAPDHNVEDYSLSSTVLGNSPQHYTLLKPRVYATQRIFFERTREHFPCSRSTLVGFYSAALQRNQKIVLLPVRH